MDHICLFFRVSVSYFSLCGHSPEGTIIWHIYGYLSTLKPIYGPIWSIRDIYGPSGTYMGLEQAYQCASFWG